MINPYIYIPLNHDINIKLVEDTAVWLRYKVDFPSARTADYLGNNRVQGEYLYPKNGDKAPLALLVHGMGERSGTHCRLIAHTLAKKGIASFILYLVFHHQRIPPEIKNKYPRLSAEEWFEIYQISVIDVRQVIDWASTRSEIIQDKISIAGISFGAFISAISMGLDQRIKAGLFIVSGGNSEKLTRHSFLLRHQYKIEDSEYRRNQETYIQYLSEVAEKGFENVAAAKTSYYTDPMTFGSLMTGRPVLMLNAVWDEMIPRVATLDLWQAYGKPPITWYPATHASIWVWYPLMSHKISGFFKSVLSGKD